ncbi:MAG: biopolymer transporter ExbD [Candidatus Riflebacteria bacterium]|nr:biopolymer transporter ExbD [Candidatus Riflebacteria bacterium]
MKKLLHKRAKTQPQIVVTNLIDIVLLLVFFFMITSSFAANEKKLPVNVPKASASVSMEKDNLTVQVTKTGNIYIAGKTVDSNSLNEQIKKWVASSPDRPVMVEADEGTNYGKVIKVLDQIRSAGAINVGLATKPEKQ